MGQSSAVLLVVGQDVKQSFSLVGQAFVGLVEVAHDVKQRAALLVAFTQAAPDAVATQAAQCGRVEARWGDPAARASRAEPGGPSEEPLHYLPQRRQEGARLPMGTDARERLLDKLGWAEPKQGKGGVVGLQDLP